jgi:hypothetical protein
VDSEKLVGVQGLWVSIQGLIHDRMKVFFVQGDLARSFRKYGLLLHSDAFVTFRVCICRSNLLISTNLWFRYSVALLVL